MRATKIAVITAMTFVFSFSGCSCGEDPLGDGSDGGPSGNDGAPFDNDGSTNNGDGSNNGNDGALVDGGNPLEQPLPDFCSGKGTVVTVSSTGDCAGELAENTFQFALCACETIDVQSNLDLDAFDSRLGTYGATIAGGGMNIQDDGHLGLNGALNMGGKLTARGAAYVGGGGFSVGSQSLVTSTAYAAGDAVQNNSSTTLGRNAYFNGNVEGRFDIAGDLHVPPTATVSAGTTVGGSIIREVIPAVRPCACEPNEILDIAAITDFGRTHNDNAVTSTVTMETVFTSSRAYENGGPATLRLPCGRYYLTRIDQPGALSIVAEGRTVLFIDGDFVIGGNFQLMLEQGAEVDIFVKGSLSVGASARFGDESQPSSVRTYVGGTGTITLSASAVFGGNLYAPRAEVVFEASSNLYGSLFARRARFDGSADIHFDSAVREAGDSCEEEMPQDDAGVQADADTSDADTTDADTTDGAPPADAATPDGSPTDGGDTPAPCMDDLDCPAPQVCVAGMCRIDL